MSATYSAARIFTIIALWLTALAAFLWARTQQSPGPAVWDDGTVQTFTGEYRAFPYPMLLADLPLERAAGSAPRTMPLVEVGKRGVTRISPAIDGQRITVSGWLLRRGGRSMIELEPNTTIVATPAEQSSSAVISPSGSPNQSRTITLRGEIVDFKCFLGAMKPGSGKAHKACASLCIACGIPPPLILRDSGGGERFYLLQSPQGAPINRALHTFIAADVFITGTLSTIGDLEVLSVTSESIGRP